MLAKRGIQCRVLSMATIKPLDVESLVRAVDETGGIVTVEEHTVDGGLGGAVAENLLDMGCIPSCYHRIGLRAGFSSIVGTQKYLRKVYGMDAPAIVAVVERRLSSRELRHSEYVAR
jgi:transketolase